MDKSGRFIDFTPVISFVWNSRIVVQLLLPLTATAGILFAPFRELITSAEISKYENGRYDDISMQLVLICSVLFSPPPPHANNGTITITSPQ